MANSSREIRSVEDHLRVGLEMPPWILSESSGVMPRTMSKLTLNSPILESSNLLKLGLQRFRVETVHELAGTEYPTHSADDRESTFVSSGHVSHSC